MSIQQHDSALFGAYVLGALDDEENREIEAHVADCEGCRMEVEALRRLETTLGEVPPEAFLDGPPEGGDLMLRRTLRQVHAERGRAETRRRAFLAAVAAVAAVSVLGAGFYLGRGEDSGAARPAIAAPTVVQTPPQGVRVASATDPGTGATMAVRVTPATEWVRVNAAVGGIPKGELCRLLVVSTSGKTEVAGSWTVGSAEKGANLDGSAAIPAKEVKEIVVENAAGKRYVTARLT
ncbi:anti-sigma factor family protein [Streptomyces qinzhouensis]|uniref:Anti-sigma factor n=1 Tax=Streptomyces qinzhouensis TaxID=2599401 RepID=A0A5B8JD60_9ACTN|nr:zf-HC2 domain-containing protein [Streptomyces qinzhouensis]QDY79437.1 anti-sigma factor [Streptomyces qinzhouensis]